MQKYIILSLIILSLSACSPVQMTKVEVEHAMLTPAISWQNYAWQPPPAAAHKLRPSYQATLQDRLAHGLQNRQIMPRKPADILVSGYVLIRRENRQAKQGYHLGAVGRQNKDRTPKKFIVQVGSVVIDLHDPTTGALLWRARSSTEINFALDEAQTKAQINNAVAAILHKLPVPAHRQP